MTLTITSNTQSASIGTEHTLHTQSTACSFAGQVSLLNMAAGDVVEIRVYNKTLTGDTITPGTTLPLYYASYSHAQSEDKVQFPALIVGYAAVVTIKQTAGTGRDFPWFVGALA